MRSNSVGCAHDHLGAPGNDRTLPDSADAFPDIETIVLEAPADEGELHVAVYGGGRSLSPPNQERPRTSLIGSANRMT